ncbi:MAG: DUF502 domain-containing protein, partial [Fusobacteriaceae bacterium]
YFYTGIVALLPIVITLYILDWIFTFILDLISTSYLAVILKRIVEKSVELSETTTSVEFLMNISINILTVILILTFVIFIGYTLKHVVFSKIIKYVNELFLRAPLIKHIYSTITQIVSVFSNDRMNSYQKVVIIEYPRKGIYSMGFLTSESNSVFEKRLNKEKMFNIFIPTSPNPTSGMFIVMEESEVNILDIKVDEAIKLIISGGVIVPEVAKGDGK